MTSDFDQELADYLRLAILSGHKTQTQGRDRFVCLAAITAMQCGLIAMANQLHQFVKTSQPHHWWSACEEMQAVMIHERFPSQQLQLRKFCSRERAELLVEQQGMPREEATREQLEELVQEVIGLST